MDNAPIDQLPSKQACCWWFGDHWVRVASVRLATTALTRQLSVFVPLVLDIY